MHRDVNTFPPMSRLYMLYVRITLRHRIKKDITKAFIINHLFPTVYSYLGKNSVVKHQDELVYVGGKGFQYCTILQLSFENKSGA